MTYPAALFLMGPTACGKTDLAVALHDRLPVEVISVDSALVYRDMDIGTAKPDAATLAACPHHLIDLLPPTEGYSAGRFRRDALALMDGITARGRVPLLVGGTMLYFRALKRGLDTLPEADPALRAELEARAARHGWPALHAELARLDPATATRLHATDAQRIQRALEVCLASGQPMSDLLGRVEATLPYRLTEIALLPGDRSWLHERIEARFDAMLNQGFLDEVRVLRARHPDLTPDLPAMRCVGYRQAWAHLDGVTDFATFRAQAIVATRQLAKRQITWLRSWEGAARLDPALPGVVEHVLEKSAAGMAS